MRPHSRPFVVTSILLPTLAALALVTLACASSPAPRDEARPPRPPNIVLIFNDDLGYADIGPFGAKGISTPNLDRMAKEGARLTSFYAAQAVCSASRAALLTGSYPNRVSIKGALFPGSKLGLHPNEVTIPELLKTRGYATAMYGKWHLGDNQAHLPTRQGFDEWFGLPYSNDMHPPGRPKDPPLPLYENEKIVATEPDQAQLVTWYTERAVRFIERNRERPFFVYVAHNMPHVPLHVSDKHKGKSARGLYGDVITEIDWSVGEILAALSKQGLERDTLVIFTSDNGPWLVYGDHSGSAAPLREGKFTAYEGGVRVPALFRWPGHIPAGLVTDEVAGTIDLLPTFARLAGATAPTDRVLDGRDVTPLLTTPGAPSPHEAFWMYWGSQLHAVRSGHWKLHFPHPYQHVIPDGAGAKGRTEERKTERALYDLSRDLGETTDVAAQNPDVVARLEALGAEARADLGDELTGQLPTRVRPAGQAE